MATIAPAAHTSSTSPSSSSSISKLISRLQRKSRSNAEPPSQNQDSRPPLKPAPLPLVLPEHQHTLSQLGWTTVSFPTSSSSSSSSSSSPHLPPSSAHPLQQAYLDLFKASQAFFALPASEKGRWKHKLGSEEGWSSIPGEKEFITLRTLSYTPDVLREPANRYWDLVGVYLDTCLDRIGTSLDLPTEQESNKGDEGTETVPEEMGLRRYVGPCKRMGSEEEEKTATMLRLFRYESWDEKIVAEPHADLGLLSLVVGDVPGLEVWNGFRFWDIEREYERWGRPCATLLGGRQLERLSNWRYVAGGHRVVSYGKPAPSPSSSSPVTRPPAEASEVGTKKYRYSIVFVLRAHEEVIVDTDPLTTSITGEFKEPVRGVQAGKWYEAIRGKHFNINIGFEEREEQRRKVAERKNKMAGKEGEMEKGSG